jgi:hypothetical protein
MKAFGRFGAIAIAAGVIIIALAFANLSKVRVAGASIPVVRADGGSILGTWIVQVAVNTPSGPQPLATELASFNSGGTFIDALSIAHSSQNPFFTGPFAPLAVDFSDALGTWKQVGDDSNQFAITFKRFIFAGPNTPTGPTGYGSFFPGQNVGVATIEAVGTLQTGAGGDTATGLFTFQLTNLSGQVVLPASGNFSATRLKIEPLAAP